MNDQRRKIGQHGEAIARVYLERKGYGIIAANWRCAAGEIDLVASDDSALVFVEVRTRRSSTRGLAEESVTPAKQRRLATLAQLYMQQLEDSGTPWSGPWRIDVVALQLDAHGRARVQHLQNVVEDVW
jgi:putative endonuclease